MIALVAGGAASGKSALAERLACALAPTRLYVATMVPPDAESRARVARHRQQRAAKAFRTVECPCRLAQVHGGEGVALLEDVGNLVANAFWPELGQDVLGQSELLDNVAAFCRAFPHVVVVGNLVGAQGAPATPAMQAYVRAVGAVCCQVAAQADAVVEVVAGQANVVKGDLPWAV